MWSVLLCTCFSWPTFLIIGKTVSICKQEWVGDGEHTGLYTVFSLKTFVKYRNVLKITCHFL